MPVKSKLFRVFRVIHRGYTAWRLKIIKWVRVSNSESIRLILWNPIRCRPQTGSCSHEISRIFRWIRWHCRQWWSPLLPQLVTLWTSKLEDDASVRIRLLMLHRLARIRLLLHRVSNKHGLSDHPIRMPFHGIQSLFFDLNGFQTFKFRTSKCSKHSERIERCSLMKRKFQRESSDAKRDSHWQCPIEIGLTCFQR